MNGTLFYKPENSCQNPLISENQKTDGKKTDATKTSSREQAIFPLDDSPFPPYTFSMKSVSHPIPPVWNEQSRILILGTMPSPKSREAGFFYMHPHNRFWRVLPAVFGETLFYTNKGVPAATNPKDSDSNTPPDYEAAISERRSFLLRHQIALWDVLSSCDIHGAADSSITNAVPNDFTPLFEKSKIRRVFCTGKTAFNLWQKFCADEYESRYGITSECLPSTSPANAAWSEERLIEAYRVIR